MGKSNTSNSSKQQHSNESVHCQKLKIFKKKKQAGGRPKIEKNKIKDNDQPEYWFQSEMANKIVRLLGSRGQIIFKCLSGQKAIKYKEQLNINIQSHLKNNRQVYLNALNEWKKKLLEKLGYKQESKEYLFLGKNENNIEFNFSRHKELNLLKDVIHPDFFKTFQEIVEKSNKQEGMSEDFSVKKIVNDYETYKMINDWALIKVLSKPYLKNLKKLQIPDDEQSKAKFNEDIEIFLENTFKDDIIGMEKDFDKSQINDEIKQKMTKKIEKLLQGIQDIIYPSQQQEKSSNDIIE